MIVFYMLKKQSCFSTSSSTFYSNQSRIPVYFLINWPYVWKLYERYSKCCWNVLSDVFEMDSGSFKKSGKQNRKSRMQESGGISEICEKPFLWWRLWSWQVVFFYYYEDFATLRIAFFEELAPLEARLQRHFCPLIFAVISAPHTKVDTAYQR